MRAMNRESNRFRVTYLTSWHGPSESRCKKWLSKCIISNIHFEQYCRQYLFP
jgi:hypothetical protein